MLTWFSRLPMGISKDRGVARILSLPVPVYWAGWETTTTRLQQQGWELQVEYDFSRMAYRMVIHHRRGEMWGLSDLVEMYRGWGSSRNYAQEPGPLHPIHIKHMASKMVVEIIGQTMSFQPIDAYPQFTNREIKRLEDMVQFATPLVRTKELIVNPDEIGKILELIQQAQLPEQEAIRKRGRLTHTQGTTIDSIAQQTFHAQIVSIAE